MWRFQTTMVTSTGSSQAAKARRQPPSRFSKGTATPAEIAAPTHSAVEYRAIIVPAREGKRCLIDRKSTRMPVTNAHLVCRLLLEKKKRYNTPARIARQDT